MLIEERGRRLVKLARDTIAVALGVRGRAVPAPDPTSEAWLLELAATFVTVHRLDRLHGCIGSIEPRRTLFDDVRSNASAAVLLDPRATPLHASDFEDLRVEVSLLSRLEPLEVRDEQDALAHLRPGRDGVVFACGGRRATFLPQVWDSLPAPLDFMAELKQKAGFPADFWSTAVRLSRYSLQKWSDDDLPRSTRPPGAPSGRDRLELT